MRFAITAVLLIGLAGCSSTISVGGGRDTGPADTSLADANGADANGADTSVADASSQDATIPDAAIDAGPFVGVGCGFSGLTCSTTDGCCADTEQCGAATCVNRYYGCDGPEDCTGGLVCCLEFATAGLQSTGSTCLATCVTGLIRYAACHAPADCDLGESCCDSMGGPTNLGGPYQACLPTAGCPD